MKNKTIPGGARVGKAIFIFFRFFLYKIETKKKACIFYLTIGTFLPSSNNKQQKHIHVKRKKERKWKAQTFSHKLKKASQKLVQSDNSSFIKI